MLKRRHWRYPDICLMPFQQLSNYYLWNLCCVQFLLPGEADYSRLLPLVLLFSTVIKTSWHTGLFFSFGNCWQCLTFLSQYECLPACVYVLVNVFVIWIDSLNHHGQHSVSCSYFLQHWLGHCLRLNLGVNQASSWNTLSPPRTHGERLLSTFPKCFCKFVCVIVLIFTPK